MILSQIYTFRKISWGILSSEIDPNTLDKVKFDIGKNMTIKMDLDSFDKVSVKLLMFENEVHINKTFNTVEFIQNHFYVTRTFGNSEHKQSKVMTSYKKFDLVNSILKFLTLIRKIAP